MPRKNALQPALDWFSSQDWKAFPFQKKAWRSYLAGKSGVINAPTGYGKTYSLAIPVLLEGLASKKKEDQKGLQCLWITPIRALAKEIHMACTRAIEALGLDWEVGIRTGDTKSSEKAKQFTKAPQIMITTPESLHILLARKGYSAYFKNLKSIIIDEWHELVGSKRGVLMQVAISRLKPICGGIKLWGISATIGNMEEAMEVMFGAEYEVGKQVLITAKVTKKIDIVSLIPDDIETFPWSGHYGTKMLEKVLPIIDRNQSTLIFTNTRAMCEIWYQKLLEANPDLAGQVAMHHGSISREIRDWVEDALHAGTIKAVVSTSSLDLGVDFRPVEAVVQIGSPKGVARCVQRAGRSGHQPGKTSVLYFVPTHALELIEAAGLREAIYEGTVEARLPYIRSFDVLCQYLVTLAVSEGFYASKVFEEIKTTHCFQSITLDEWNWCLSFITLGGPSLQAYDEYQKVNRRGDLYFVSDKRIALRHRLSIGTIVGDISLTIKYVSGKRLGTIEEWFITHLIPGDVFWFAGRSLEFVRIKDSVVQVRRSNKKTGKVPSWQGGRMPFSSRLSQKLRQKVFEYHDQSFKDREMNELLPLLNLQDRYSHVPRENEFLIELFESKEGHHMIMYPFEGRFVHEGLGAVFAKRIASVKPMSFSIAMNDYGFELLSDQEIPLQEAIEKGLFSDDGLEEDIQQSINQTELAKRHFREISRISGLVFAGYPGKQKKERHLQTSAGLLFEVFRDYEPDNLLFLQTYDEAKYFQLEEHRLRAVLERILSSKIVIKKADRFSPFALPIIADRLRAKMTSEKLEDRIQKMKLALIEG
jgi:ATP-dependent Lhr-like helicase